MLSDSSSANYEKENEEKKVDVLFCSAFAFSSH
jgi:hypothetical protein